MLQRPVVVAPIVRSLRNGEDIGDAELDDAFFPASTCRLSAMFWTPVEVTARVVDLLAPSPKTRILDVGSGVGKFCIVGAALSRGTFVGVEQRAHLVRIARSAAARSGLRRARFVHGDLRAIDVAAFDVLYFYNPFAENVMPRSTRIDDRVALSAKKRASDIARARSMLLGAKRGTRVVTYHGFGGVMPRGYSRAHSESCNTGFVELWIKRS